MRKPVRVEQEIPVAFVEEREVQILKAFGFRVGVSHTEAGDVYIITARQKDELVVAMEDLEESDFDCFGVTLTDEEMARYCSWDDPWVLVFQDILARSREAGKAIGCISVERYTETNADAYFITEANVEWVGFCGFVEQKVEQLKREALK